ncbi:MAG: aromatic ring-hydroxylating dioxygenase subunit alpha, partial [Candidatus Binatia bacterium]
VYTDPRIYRREQERIFRRRSWNYVALDCEIPRPGDFKRSTIGELPVVVARNREGRVGVFVNRCAHRGVELCVRSFGNTETFMCPYHQWTYDLDGNLKAVPFRKGVQGSGGMPADFSLAEHGLERLTVAERHGVIFASFDPETPPLEEYLGATNLGWFDRVFDGRELRLLGYQRQVVPANWKLMFENIKDPYHASLLHVFLVSFGLFRADMPSAVQMDESGQHAVLVSSKGEQKQSAATADMKSFRADLRLRDPRLLDPVREFAGPATVVMQTIWPNLIVQQQSNTLATRQLVTRGPAAFELHWTFFGYRDDDAEMTLRRLRQANLMGPAGLVSIDDSEIMRLAQLGCAAGGGSQAVVEMGGREVCDTDHMVTEVAIRAFYAHYRRAMEL